MQPTAGLASQEGIGQLNQHFWDRFNSGRFADMIFSPAHEGWLTTSRLIQSLLEALIKLSNAVIGNDASIEWFGDPQKSWKEFWKKPMIK